MSSLMSWALVLSTWAIAQAPGGAADGNAKLDTLANQISVELRVPRTVIPVAGQVMVEFVILNRTAEPVTLKVPNAKTAKMGTGEMGLPLEHVYSGTNFRALEIATDGNPKLGDRSVRNPEYPVPAVTLAAFGTVGLRFDVSRFYPVLNQAGTYVLRWNPYGGAVRSKPVTIRVVPFKQAIIDTNYGPLSMRLLYDKAPRHVENFIDLINQRFYNGLTFHRILPGAFLQGGCPDGTGLGKRPDGVTIAPEFNNTQFVAGTVAMALVESDEGRDETSASSQFFISLGRQPAWDGRYTAFAVIEGPESLAVLKRLAEVATDDTFSPVEPLKIRSISLLDLPYSARMIGE